jgi:hypothetical protein
MTGIVNSNRPYFGLGNRQLRLPVALPLQRPPTEPRTLATSWGAPLPVQAKQRKKEDHPARGSSIPAEESC